MPSRMSCRSSARATGARAARSRRGPARDPRAAVASCDRPRRASRAGAGWWRGAGGRRRRRDARRPSAPDRGPEEGEKRLGLAQVLLRGHAVGGAVGAAGPPSSTPAAPLIRGRCPRRPPGSRPRPPRGRPGATGAAGSRALRRCAGRFAVASAHGRAEPPRSSPTSPRAASRAARCTPRAALRIRSSSSSSRHPLGLPRNRRVPCRSLARARKS